MNQALTAGRIFHIYRLGLSGILLSAYVLLAPEISDEFTDARWFLITTFSWFWIAAATSFGARVLKFQERIINISFTIDMIALSILGWASGGLSAGIQFLMLPTAALAGLALTARIAFFVAAVGTIGAFTSQTILILGFHLPTSIYFQTGLLGITIFLCTLTFKGLGSRLSRSEKIAQENALKAAALQKLNNAIIDEMTIGVLSINQEEIIELANMAAEQMLSSGQQFNRHVTGSSLSEHPKLYNTYKKWLENPEEPVKTIVQTFSGVTLQPVFNALSSDEHIQTLVWLEDVRITKRRAQEMKMDSLSELSAGLAHEIRNPLSAVQQACELLHFSPSLSESEKEMGNVILRHCHRMNEIIDVVQQLSRRVEAQIQPLQWSSWINDFEKEYRETHTNPVKISIENNLSNSLYFDPRHMKQILTNLFDNAIRYSREAVNRPYVRLCCSFDSTGKMVFLDIHDLGKGVSRLNHENIFAPFFTTEASGSGLGLYLVRELCEANSASINYLYADAPEHTGYFRISVWVQPPRGY